MSSVSRSVGRPVARSVLAGQLNNLASIIKSIFATGEQGFAYDPNDLSTMYQDAAGTIPVTAQGQPVGLMKDKSGRNNHASQTVSASRPILQRNATTGAYYLVFDGVDDFLQTNSIDFTATDKMSLFAGVRKLSDSIGMVAEIGVGAGNGVFGVNIGRGSGKSIAFLSKGTVGVEVFAPQSLAPTSSLITAKGDISAPLASAKVNGAGNTNITTQGTGNYGNYPLYIGRRGGTSLPFNGHLYGLIGIGRLATDSETVAIEKALAKNTGVTLNV